MIDTTLIEKAARMAVIAHDGQSRKAEDTPYAVHPFVVALKLTAHDFSETVIAAALVHDVIEDTNVGEKILRETLGEDVLALVKTFSEDKTLPWEERKKQYINTIRKGSDEAKAISAADKIHNLESLLRGHAEHGEALWAYFTRSKDQQVWFVNEMLSMLRDTWQHPLVDEYEMLCQKLKTLV